MSSSCGKTHRRGQRGKLSCTRRRTVPHDGCISDRESCFRGKTKAYAAEVDEFVKLDNADNCAQVVSLGDKIQDKLEAAARRIEEFNERDGAFGIAPSDYPTLDAAQEKFMPIFNLWTMLSDFNTKSAEWKQVMFTTLEPDEVEREVENWWTSSYRMMKTLADESPETAEVAAVLRERSTAFKEYLPIVRSLASKALRERHWDKLSRLIMEDVTPDESLTLQRLLDMDIMKHWEQVETITVVAEKEYSLQKTMAAMGDDWAEVEFECMAYKETGTYVIKGTDDILGLLDDQIVKIQTLLGSPYIKPIIKQAKAWEKKLLYVQTSIDEWLKVQRGWMYLEPIFWIRGYYEADAHRGQAFCGGRLPLAHNS